MKNKEKVIVLSKGRAEVELKLYKFLVRHSAWQRFRIAIKQQNIGIDLYIADFCDFDWMDTLEGREYWAVLNRKYLKTNKK